MKKIREWLCMGLLVLALGLLHLAMWIDPTDELGNMYEGDDYLL
jgi:hypothetical protein